MECVYVTLNNYNLVLTSKGQQPEGVGDSSVNVVPVWVFQVMKHLLMMKNVFDEYFTTQFTKQNKIKFFI